MRLNRAQTALTFAVRKSVSALETHTNDTSEHAVSNIIREAVVLSSLVKRLAAAASKEEVLADFGPEKTDPVPLRDFQIILTALKSKTCPNCGGLLF